MSARPQTTRFATSRDSPARLAQPATARNQRPLLGTQRERELWRDTRRIEINDDFLAAYLGHASGYEYIAVLVRDRIHVMMGD